MFSRHHDHKKKSQTPIYNPLNGMHVEFMGPNTIVNNGQLPNTLKIGVTNNNLFHASNPDELVISFDAENELFLFFIVDEKQASAKDHEVNWALTSEDHFNKIEVHFINPAGDDQNPAWKKKDYDAHTFHTIDVPQKFGKSKTETVEDQKSRNSTLKGWKLTPSHPVHLNPGETLCIQVSNIISDMPDGITTAFIGVGVQKKERTLDAIGQIVKSPVFVKNQKVGIGTNDPKAMLHVDGRIQDKTGDVIPVGAIIAYGGSTPPAGWLLCDGRDINSLPVPADKDKGIYQELCNVLKKREKITGITPATKNVTKHSFPLPAFSLPDEIKWTDAQLKKTKSTFLPDLRSRFIVGAGTGEVLVSEKVSYSGGILRASHEYTNYEKRNLKTYKQNDIGGEEEVNLNENQIPNHSHAIQAVNYSPSQGTKSSEILKTLGEKTGSDDIPTKGSGGGDPHENLPPYYALTYIIKY